MVHPMHDGFRTSITLTNNDGAGSPDSSKPYNDFFIIDQVLDTLHSSDISNFNLPSPNNNVDLLCTENELNNALTTITENSEINRNSAPIDEILGFKKPPTTDLNCSTNSLNSENLSSPMQTSTDVFLDSEILSTDSQSPKNAEKTSKPTLTYKKKSLNLYASNETFSNTKSDQSLLNSTESCDSSPIHKINRDYKKVQRKYKTKKYFGVKTLQSIFSSRGGYSDISSTASDFGDDLLTGGKEEPDGDKLSPGVVDNNNGSRYNFAETTPQFEENIHHILSEMFGHKLDVSRNATKKCLRVGKALRLCPIQNDDSSAATSCTTDNDQKREKLLARYVYNANSLNADGVGDPDFGTPV